MPEETYRVVQKKCPILFFIPKLCFTIFFHIFQVVSTAGLGDYFDTNMDPTGCYTTQQRMKITEAYFAAKSVCRQISGDMKCSRCRFYQVYCSCQKSHPHCLCIRRTDFVVKYASMIFIRCCMVNCPSIWSQKNLPGLLSKPPEKYAKKL